MTKQQEHDLNFFFKTTFNKILALEEHALQNTNHNNLTVHELHLLEACHSLEEENENTMSHIASKLSITKGALTTAVNTLVRKKYATRGSDAKDKRIVYLYLTKTGLDAYYKHEEFHKQMLKNVSLQLDDTSLTTLTNSLKKLSNFFEQYDN